MWQRIGDGIRVELVSKNMEVPPHVSSGEVEKLSLGRRTSPGGHQDCVGCWKSSKKAEADCYIINRDTQRRKLFFYRKLLDEKCVHR